MHRTSVLSSRQLATYAAQCMLTCAILKLATFLFKGTSVTVGDILFAKIDKEEIEKLDAAKKAAAAAAGPAAPAAAAPGAGLDGPALEKAVADQGGKVRQLKKDKADTADIKAAVAVLLALKKRFEEVTGAAPAPGKAAAPAAVGGGDGEAILAKVTAQGLVVRDLKTAKADKAEITAAVDVLLALKKEYKAVTGNDVPGPPKKQKKKK